MNKLGFGDLTGIAFTCEVEFPPFILWESLKPVDKKLIVVFRCAYKSQWTVNLERDHNLCNYYTMLKEI